MLVHPKDASAQTGLQSFYSYPELKTYLDRNSPTKGPVATPSTDQNAGAGSGSEHSTTNVQVAGVQEEDRALTDGNYIYSAGQASVSIVRAIPASEMSNVSWINMSMILGSNGTDFVYVLGLYLVGDRLVVLCQVSAYSQYGSPDVEYIMAPSVHSWETRTIACIFDVGEPGAPVLKQTSGVSGTFTTSRMQGDELYIFTTQYAWGTSAGSGAVPASFSGSSSSQFEPMHILYDPQTAQVNCFLNLVRLNVTGTGSEEIAFLTDYSSVLYMSENSIYLTYAHNSYSPPVMTMDDTAVSSQTRAGSYTTIYRINTGGNGLAPDTSGTVRGTPVDRYAIDERDGCLRIATTEYGNVTQTLVSVMSTDLSVVGQIGGIGVGETMLSSRYVNDTLYLITYRQIDSLYAIDLSVPANPRILGELTMPGYSEYLQPVDGMHLIGLGFEGHSMKVSLFNISDPTHPTEERKMLLSNFSYSPALYDQHAVTFYSSRSLFIVPVSGYDQDSGQYHCAAYVFNTSAAISLVGTAGSNNSGGVDRTLYINDTLYVCSPYSISAYGLADTSYRGSIALGSYEPYKYWYSGSAGDPIPL